MDARLLVDRVKQGRLLSLVGRQGRSDIKLETLGKVVLKLKLRFEHIGSRPCFGEDKAVLLVSVLGLDITGNDSRFRVPVSADFECNIGGRFGLDLQRCAMERVVLPQQVIRGLSEVLNIWTVSFTTSPTFARCVPPSMRGELAEGETLCMRIETIELKEREKSGFNWFFGRNEP